MSEMRRRGRKKEEKMEEWRGVDGNDSGMEIWEEMEMENCEELSRRRMNSALKRGLCP
jgi:hypothetical protein